MDVLAQPSDEEVSWNRALTITGRPKSSLLAKQILNPTYFRDMYIFCQKLADSHWAIRGFLVTVDEVEGAIRIWADSANIKPATEFEEKLWPLLDQLAHTFDGWQPSKEASIDILEFHDNDEDELSTM